MTRSRAPNDESRSLGIPSRAGLRSPGARFRALTLRLGIRPQNAFVLAAFAFLVATIVVTGTHLARERLRALETASRDIALCAGDLARRIDAELLTQKALPLDEALQKALFDGKDLACGAAVVAEAGGSIVASHPARPTRGATLAGWFGVAEHPEALTEGSAAVAVETSDGQSVLAARRPLQAANAQVAIYQPIRDALEEWRDRATLVAALLVALAGALVGTIAYAKLQSQRTQFRAYRESMRRAHTEVALSRGRCGLWDWDLDNGEVTWSQSMFDILELGHRPRLTIDEIDALTHPDDRPIAALVAEATASGEGSIDIEFRMGARDGQWIWLRQRAAIVEDATVGCKRLVGVALDVTERKREAQRSATADQRLREAIEAISEAFVLWDSSNRLVLCNSKYQRLHNLPPDVVRAGVPYAELHALATPPVVSSETPLHPREEAMGDERARTYEARLSDGRWLQVNERRTRDGGFVSVGTDITALKEHEEELVRSEQLLLATVAQLRQSRRVLEDQAVQLSELAARYQEQKIAAEAANLAKAEFLANMGHELRTPLNAIIGFSEMMGAETFGPLGSERYREYSEHIQSSGQQLLGVFSDVLDMARLESGRTQLEYSHFEVCCAIRAALADVNPTVCEKRLRIRVDVDPAETVNADRAALERILTTLLRNAVKYSPEDGAVTVGAQTLKDRLYVYVEDDGPGIPQDDLERLGRPFVQGQVKLDNGMKGSGLGLAIAKSFVELHGGDLRLSSDPGKGTVALVAIPKAAPRRRARALAAVA